MDPAVDAQEALALASEGFLADHPDLNNRGRGWNAYNADAFDAAMTYFKRAARYADKPSQAMVAEMLWKGQGTQPDPALAYVWMDLAAERGYESFAIMRERYWRQLDDAQRADALARGVAVYEAYGDAVAKPRIATVLRRARARTTGSRTGFVGNLRIEIPGPGGIMQSIDGSTYYASKFWDPEEYQAWHDAVWQRPRAGTVNVGDIEPLRPDQTRTGTEDAQD